MSSPNRRVVLIPTTTITTNATTTGTAITGLAGVTYIAVESILVVGSAGGTADVYVQTSFDNGVTWVDVMNHHFTTSTASKISSVKAGIASTAGITPGAGALASNTIVDGVIGDQLRAICVTAGTSYGANSSISVYAVLKGTYR